MKYVQTGKNAILGAAAAVMIAGGVSMALAQEIPIPHAAAPFVPFGERGQASQQDVHNDDDADEDRRTFVIRLRAATEATPTPETAHTTAGQGGSGSPRRSVFTPVTPTAEPGDTDLPGPADPADESPEDEPDDTPTPKPQVNPQLGSRPTDLVAPVTPTPPGPGPLLVAVDLVAAGPTGEDEDEPDGEGTPEKPLTPPGIGLAAQPVEQLNAQSAADLAVVSPTPEPEPSRTIMGGVQKLTTLEDEAPRAISQSR